MATVTGLTAERMQEVIDQVIVSAEINVDGDLILETFAGAFINAGNAHAADVMATDSVAGLVELATEAEVVAGTDNTRAVTPAGLDEKIVTYLDPDDYTQSTAADQYPVGVSLLYLSAANATAGGWDFGGKWGLVRSICFGTDVMQTWQRVGDSGIQPEFWNRCGNLAGGWTSWVKHDETIVPDASATIKGKVELATPAESSTGTDTTRAVTPEGLRQALNDIRVATTSRTSNSSGVTSTTDISVDSVVAATVTGLRYTVRWVGQVQSTDGTGYARGRIREDSASGNQLVLRQVPTGVANQSFGLILECEYVADADENKTFHATIARQSGSGTVSATAATDNPTLFYVERIE